MKRNELYQKIEQKENTVKTQLDRINSKIYEALYQQKRGLYNLLDHDRSAKEDHLQDLQDLKNALTCSECNGTGEAPSEKDPITERVDYTNCPVCKGHGVS